jgi:hypothetical protein
MIGYVPEGTSIRPMYGLPAAGAIGRAIDSGRAFSQMAISPQQTFALAIAADTGEPLVVKPGVSATAIASPETNPSMLAMSPHGTSAAMWFPLTGHLETITGLPTAPVLSTVDASFLNASPLALAISDDGQWSVGLFGAAVYAFGPNSSVVPLQTDPGVVALAFFHNSHDLALATTNRATRIADVGGANQASVLFEYSAQPLTPHAIALSFDNQLAVVADVKGTLLNIAVSTATASTFDCACSPQGLYGLGGALFRLNGTATSRSGSKAELKLFDAAAGNILIVPPAPAGGRQ